MRLYPKKLNSVAELKREKRLLKLERKNTDLKDLFSADGEPSSAGEKESGTGGLLGMALSLMGSESLLGAAFKHAPSILGMFSKKKTKQEYVPPVAEEKGPSLLMKAVKEVGFGYLKWKAIELSFKGIKKLINSPKHKEEA
ncbi:MAG: hypothetical protein JSS96_05310 [Bacteroidetes bacterium]|nr:hypothetical protein [Bacteroidota bacterium]